MLRGWLSAHKSLIITATSGSLVAALVATLAIVSGGYEAQRLDLGDGSVWVANGSQQVIGRANTEILSLDTVVASSGADLQVVQDDSTVLLLDRGNSKVDIVDPATADVIESVPLPPDAPEVFLTGDRVVIHAARTGEVWIMRTTDLSSFEAESEPDRSLGADSAVSVSPDGSIFLYSADAGEVYQVDAATGETVATSEANFEGRGEARITSVAGRWVLLDASSGQMSVDGRTVDLPARLRGAVLQEASEDGDDVLVGYDGGLLAVGLDGGNPRTLSDAQPGNAAPPLRADGCTFAAWSGGILWRQCGGEKTGTELSLESVPNAATLLKFAVNGDRVVLNDPQSGGTWAVQRSGELINNWAELIVEAEDQQEVEEASDETPPEYEKNQVPPVAVDDEFGARAGRATVLPVLLNDYDPNGDVLVVDAVDGADDVPGRLDVIENRQTLQLTLDAAATGTFSFGYSISDGLGGTARATVTVTVRAPEENNPPIQVRHTRAVVAEGGRVTIPVLGDWVDPDGDAFYLTSASAVLPDTVTYKAEGTVTFREGGGAGDSRSIALVVSDGQMQGTGSLPVSVKSAGQVPLVADGFVVPAYAGQEVIVKPLDHVRGGDGTLRLSGVPPKPGATIVTSLETGTFRFSSDQVRSHNLEYVVNDGDQTVTGVVRIVVTAPPDPNATPITIPKKIFVRTLSSETVDVASTDTDPAGGVLLVTAVNNVPRDSGVRAEVLEQRAIKVTLTKPLPAGITVFNYRITNGLAAADGTVTVIEIPRPVRSQPPVATDDSVTVRLGDTIDIPVLHNDVHPDGDELTLDADLVTGLRRESGLLFASGNVLRYLAPNRTGNFTAVYQISGPDGQVDQAQVTIAVREAVEATNAAPVPSPIVARVIAGETVRIPVPLSGIDPDGDSVQLLGQETNPEKGSVSGVGADYIDYVAGDYSAGTDTFTYGVIDALGARASGSVRVGISPRAGGARNPVAIADEARVRPGKTVSVRVLANDSDPDGSALSVLSVDPNSVDIQWKIEGDVVRITPPLAAGSYGLVYTIQNTLGGSSSNFITVVVDPDAPPSLPIAKDTVLTLADIVDRKAVTVNVLRNVFFADGDVSSLELSVLPGFGGTATVTHDKRVRVSITNTRQIIPFAVANPDDPKVVAYAFVLIPGAGDALPQLDPTARPLTVASEAALTIDLGDYVIAVGGRRVRVADATSVQATHANGDNLVVDDETLRFTSADNYFGPASISFDVTDGASGSAVRTATLVLPIKVTPRQNQPPTFNGGVVDFEPGESKSLDLVKLTTYPSDDVRELVFRAESAPPAGFEYTITGSNLEIRANEKVAKGTTTALTIGVRDGVSTGVAGRIQLNVVGSTRPLARPAPDSVVVPRGQTTTVDVLANDDAANPFPGTPLSVIGIRGLAGGALPAGVTITPSADNSTLRVSASASAAPVDTNLQYQVADATRDPERYAFGVVKISVQDRPDAPGVPSRADGGYEEGQLTLRLTAPVANNSPITKYEVLSSSHGEYRMDCGTSQLCTLDGLVPGLRYQFTVVATNAVGPSAASPVSAPLSADYLPAASTQVTAVPAKSTSAAPAIDVRWAAVPRPNPGSGLSGYNVRVTGPGVDWSTAVDASTLSLTTTAGGALAPNQLYIATVYAKNEALVLSDDDWRRTQSAPVRTVGAPSGVVVMAASVADADGDIQVTWTASDPNGGTAVTYSVGRIRAGDTVPATCTVGKPGKGVVDGGATSVSSGWTDTGAADRETYRYVVYAENGFYCTPSASGPVEGKAPAGVPVVSTTLEAHGGQSDLRVSFEVGGANRVEARLNGAAWATVTSGSWLTSAVKDQSVYGNTQVVEYRACRDALSTVFCSAPTGATTLTPINADGTFTCAVGQPVFAAAPRNANVRIIEYLYSFNDGSGWSPFSAADVAPPPLLEPLGSGVTRALQTTTVTLGSGESFTYTEPAPGTDQPATTCSG